MCRMIVAECKRHSIDMKGPETTQEFYSAIDKLVQGKVRVTGVSLID